MTLKNLLYKADDALATPFLIAIQYGADFLHRVCAALPGWMARPLRRAADFAITAAAFDRLRRAHRKDPATAEEYSAVENELLESLWRMNASPAEIGRRAAVVRRAYQMLAAHIEAQAPEAP